MSVDTDRDTVLEVFLENGKIRTPYERHESWDTCSLNRWAEPGCVPAIGTKVYIDEPFDPETFAAEFEAEMRQSGKGFFNTYTRPYILVVHGNDQYISIYPAVEEIGPNHVHRKLVESHVAARGLNYLHESYKPTKPKLKGSNGQVSYPGGSEQDPGGFGLTTGFGKHFCRLFPEPIVPSGIIIGTKETGS